MRPVSEQIGKAHEFLVKAYADGRTFTYDEFRTASGWSAKTMRAYWSKKLRGFVEQHDGKWRARAMEGITLEAFGRTCSQSSARSADPLRPDLPPEVECRILKARDAALAAVQHYNNPTAGFRSDTYVMLMIVAFTALFHAMCERDRVDYKAYSKDGKAKLTGAGDAWLWDVSACATHYVSIISVAVKTNLEFMLGLRHRIEHRFVPLLDVRVASECQALLLNFERVLTSQFGDFYALGTSLATSLQLSSIRPRAAVPALRLAEAAAFGEVSKWVSDFRRAIPDDVFADPGYAVRVWLVPKSANEARRSDIVLEYLDTRDCDDETRAKLANAIVEIRTKVEQVYAVADSEWLWEQDLTKQLVTRIGTEVCVNGASHKLTNSLVRDVLKAAQVRSRPEWCFVAHKKGARPCYSPYLVDLIASAHTADEQLFHKAHKGEEVQLTT